MPRDIPIGNGQMLVAFDHHYQVRDIYFPHVGQENHAGGGPCRFGVWSDIDTPRKSSGGHPQDKPTHRLYWTDHGWDIDLGYVEDSLATQVTLTHPVLNLTLRCTDVIDFHRPVMVRRIEIANLTDRPRQVHLFHHNDLMMYGSKVGDTAFFDPKLRSVIHYRKSRYLMACWYADGEPRIDEYATGTAGFNGAEGTWRDAEDGRLGNNAIAQGAVDSTIMLQVPLGPKGTANDKRIVYLVLGAGFAYREVAEVHRFLNRESPQGVIDRTTAYWRLWLAAARTQFPAPEHHGPSPKVTEIYKRSLLILRTQIDNSGAIIAANDSDFMQYSRDTYSYLWPRDGALVAAALDDAGLPDIAKSFYTFCSNILTDHGCFLHKYNPDGSLASSWHPWVSLGNPQLPIQEDETALVVWALWRHYEHYRDIEFVRPLWLQLVTRAADFLVRFRDPRTKLPLPSYDLWEERWGVHAFTVASVYGGLMAAYNFAVCFGDTRRANTYQTAAQEMRIAFEKHMWSEEHQRFYRRIVPLDHEHTARMVALIMAGRSPRLADLQPGSSVTDINKPKPPEDLTQPPPFEVDHVIDSSMYAIFAFGLLDVGDERVDKTMKAIEKRLWVRTPVGGVARYEGDTYHRVTDDTAAVPGNPWFICTLWLAQWHIARAKNAAELRQALPILDWVATRALKSGVLAEQVHPLSNHPLSVSPLTWSHATVVATLLDYARKLDTMNACPSCGRPMPHDHDTKPTAMNKRSRE
ncbi:MAG: glycoside hydrolase family 15 protein [Phycisphaera sp.]|nr:glycoside hydrolase family 15 protein [Phycisphaera sp.]